MIADIGENNPSNSKSKIETQYFADTTKNPQLPKIIVFQVITKYYPAIDPHMNNNIRINSPLRDQKLFISIFYIPMRHNIIVVISGSFISKLNSYFIKRSKFQLIRVCRFAGVNEQTDR